MITDLEDYTTIKDGKFQLFLEAIKDDAKAHPYDDKGVVRLWDGGGFDFDDAQLQQIRQVLINKKEPIYFRKTAMSDNINPQKMLSFLRMLRGVPAVHGLIISSYSQSNKSTIADNDAFIEVIADIIEANPNLKKCELHGVIISDKGAKRLAEAIILRGTNVYLNLKSCLIDGMTKIGLQTFIGTFKFSNTVRVSLPDSITDKIKLREFATPLSRFQALYAIEFNKSAWANPMSRQWHKEVSCTMEEVLTYARCNPNSRTASVLKRFNIEPENELARFKDLFAIRYNSCFFTNPWSETWHKNSSCTMEQIRKYGLLNKDTRTAQVIAEFDKMELQRSLSK